MQRRAHKRMNDLSNKMSKFWSEVIQTLREPTKQWRWPSFGWYQAGIAAQNAGHRRGFFTSKTTKRRIAEYFLISKTKHGNIGRSISSVRCPMFQYRRLEVHQTVADAIQRRGSRPLSRGYVPRSRQQQQTILYGFEQSLVLGTGIGSCYDERKTLTHGQFQT